MSNKKIAISMIVLIAAIFLLVLLTGYSALNNAESRFAAQDYAGSAQSFERAARLLPWRVDLWEKAGISAARNGQPPQALAYFRHVSILTEDGWLWRGFAHLSLGDSDSAIATLEQGLLIYDSPAMYGLLASAYRQQKDMEAECDALENQLRLEPKGADVYTYYRLGLLLMVLEPEQALTHLMFAASLDPDYDPAVQTLRSALNLSATQPNASQQTVTIGRALGLVKEWDLALAAFEKAISLDEKNAEAWAWLGEAKQQVNPLGQNGLVELDHAVLLDHTSAVVRGLRALYWDREGKYSQMLAEYLLAAEYDPDNPAWQVGIGETHAKRGDLVSALVAYQHATELAPNESTYWMALAIFCVENGIYLDDVGLPAAQKAAELSPDDPFALDLLGWAYLASGRYANAEQVLSDAVKRFPAHLSAHMHLAMTYLAQGNHPAALEKLNYIQQTDPNGEYGEMAGRLLKQYFP